MIAGRRQGPRQDRSGAVPMCNEISARPRGNVNCKQDILCTHEAKDEPEAGTRWLVKADRRARCWGASSKKCPCCQATQGSSFAVILGRRAAFVAALEAVAAQREIEDVTDVPERLRPFLIRREGEGLLGVSEAAKRLEVSRTTVHGWARASRLIAWKTTKRGLRIPAGRILGAGPVVPGLKDVVDSVGDPELALEFLVQEWPFETAVASPLQLPKDGRIDEVPDAESGFGAAFT